MNLHQLRIFLCVAKHRHFTKAAGELYMTQPAVSTQIKQLERSLDVKLFEQLGKTIHLTEAGELLQGRAKRILNDVEQTEQVINELKGLKRGRIRIGASTTPGNYILPDMLATFKEEHPGIELDVMIDNTLNIERKILENELDVGFVGGHLVEKELEAVPFLEDELVFFVSPKHPFVKKRSISIEDMIAADLIFRERGSATREIIEKWLEQQGVQMRVIMALANPEAVKHSVAAGLGVSILSKFAIAWELKAKRLAAVKVRGFSLTRPLSVAYHKDKKHSKAAAALLEMASRLV